MVAFVRDLAGRAGRALTIDAGDLERLGSEEQLQFVIERALAAKVLSGDIDVAEIRRLFTDVFKPNVEAVVAYQPQPYRGRMMLARAAERIGAYATAVESDALGWEGLALGGVEVQDVPGNHYTIVQEPHVRILGDRLREYLDAMEPMAAPAAHQEESWTAGRS